MKINRLFSYILIPMLLTTFCIYPATLRSQNHEPGTIEKGNISKLVSQYFTQAAKKATPAVVSIRATLSLKKNQGYPLDEQSDSFQEEMWRRLFGLPTGPQKQERRTAPVSQGSGFVVTSDGKILTNNHVIDGSDKITVIFSDGKEFPAKVIGRDPNTDIALLQIESSEPFPYLTLADSDQLEVGEWVIACGNLLGFQTSITVGVVSAKGRNELDLVPIEEYIQTDAAINRGNSGGPLLNLDGEVEGMNTAFATNTGGYIGLGFAIPSNLIKHIMEELLKHGKVIRGFLGVTLQPIDSELAQAFHLPKVEGALVTDIVKDGPAANAGIKPGDIVLKVNSQPVNNSGSLRTIISLMHPGDQVALTIRRNDTELLLNATLGTFPESEIAAAEVQNNLGVVVQELTDELSKQYGYGNEKGVFIKYVDPNSFAFDAGLRPGQMILSVNRIPVTTPEQFYKTVQESTSKNQLLLHIRAGQAYRFISLRVE